MTIEAIQTAALFVGGSAAPPGDAESNSGEAAQFVHLSHKVNRGIGILPMD
jgi:hypothetical protein